MMHTHNHKPACKCTPSRTAANHLQSLTRNVVGARWPNCDTRATQGVQRTQLAEIGVDAVIGVPKRDSDRRTTSTSTSACTSASTSAAAGCPPHSDRALASASHADRYANNHYRRRCAILGVVWGRQACHWHHVSAQRASKCGRGPGVDDDGRGAADG